MDDAGLVPGCRQGAAGLHKEPVLLGGVGNVFLGGVIGHREVLEQAGHFQAGQGAGGDGLGNGGIKIGAQSKADAAHAGIHSQMHFDPAPGGLCGLAQGLGLGQGIAGRGDIVPDEGGGVCGLHMAQNEDGQGLAAPAQLQGLGQAADSQPGSALLRKDPGALDGTVAVAVGLDHGTQGQAACPLLYGAEVGPQGIEVDLSPDMFFKVLHLHDAFPPLGMDWMCVLYGPAASRRCRSPAEHGAFFAGRRGRCGSAPGQNPWFAPARSHRRRDSGS